MFNWLWLCMSEYSTIQPPFMQDLNDSSQLSYKKTLFYGKMGESRDELGQKVAGTH